METAENWRWSSLWRRTFGTEEQKLLLSDWPLPQPSRWKAHVNGAQSESEVQAVREAIRRGCPFGSPAWQKRTAGRLGLGQTKSCVPFFLPFFFQEGQIVLPVPHTHNYHAEYDAAEEELAGYWDWRYSRCSRTTIIERDRR